MACVCSSTPGSDGTGSHHSWEMVSRIPFPGDQYQRSMLVVCSSTPIDLQRGAVHPLLPLVTTATTQTPTPLTTSATPTQSPLHWRRWLNLTIQPWKMFLHHSLTCIYQDSRKWRIWLFSFFSWQMTATATSFLPICVKILLLLLGHGMSMIVVVETFSDSTSQSEATPCLVVRCPSVVDCANVTLQLSARPREVSKRFSLTVPPLGSPPQLVLMLSMTILTTLSVQLLRSLRDSSSEIFFSVDIFLFLPRQLSRGMGYGDQWCLWLCACVWVCNVMFISVVCQTLNRL